MPPTSSWQTYKRLIGFTRPYRWRLIVGVLCGMVAGGSLLGVFQYAPRLIEPFEQRPAALVAEEAEAPAEKHEALEVSPLGSLGDYLAERFNIPQFREDGTISWQFMLLGLLGLPLFFAVRTVAVFLNSYYMHWIGSRLVLDLRNRIFMNLQDQSLAFFAKSNVGSLISHITNDANILETVIVKNVTNLTQAPMVLLAAGFAIVHTVIVSDFPAWFFGLVLFVPLVFIPIIVLGRRVRHHTEKALQGIGRLVSRMQENLTGIRVVKAFHTEDQEYDHFKAMNRQYFRNIVRAFRAQLWVPPFIEFLGVIVACIGLVVCFALGIRLSSLAPLGLAMYVAYEPVKQLAKMNVSLQRSVAAANRLFALMDADLKLPVDPQAVARTEFRDCIRFENVSFAYGPQDPPAVEDICFELPRGRTIAFVGETGSGKTTVANLLARFYDPSSGRILLDGLDLRKIEIASLRRLIGVVTQETILFNETIADNIAYGSPEATIEDIVRAAKQANAHDFIIATPEGYNRVVGDKGFVLSGGQRQRIAIARAILRNPPILILDEATSALDTATEQLVQEALLHLMENRTVFAIAHRLSTIKHAEQICVLDQGRIIERGTHDELYRQCGVYHRLCDIQFS